MALCSPPGGTAAWSCGTPRGAPRSAGADASEAKPSTLTGREEGGIRDIIPEQESAAEKRWGSSVAAVEVDEWRTAVTEPDAIAATEGSGGVMVAVAGRGIELRAWSSACE